MRRTVQGTRFPVRHRRDLPRAIAGPHFRAQPADETRAAPPWLERLRVSIHDRPGRPIRVAELAAEAGVHPAHLARIFRRHHGCTVGTYVRRLRLEAARAALLDGDRTISAIALSNGFSDQAHFTRRFKEMMGVPPGEYRRLAAH